MKPRILSFIYSTGFRQTGEVGDALGILNTIRPGYLPNNFSFFIIAIIQGIDSEAINRLKVAFVDTKENKTLLETDYFEIPVGPVDLVNPLPKEAHILNFQLDLRNIQFENEGWHKSVVFFNDEVIHEAYIYVAGKKLK